MPRLCFILIAGLDDALLQRVPGLPTLGSLAHRAVYQPALPAVTCTAQATLTTGVAADRHGIVCNGLYTHAHPELHKHLDLANHADSRTQVSFWEQSNGLLQAPRFWSGTNKKTAMLFWQNCMPDASGAPAAADILLTPKPQHTPDGKTLTACFSAPADLYPALVAQLGPFPLHNYWSPMAGLPSSQWIARASEFVWRSHAPDLQLVYIPHLDFNLQRLGPSYPALQKDLEEVDVLLEPLVRQVRADGGTVIIAGDYGMSDVGTPIFPNLALRDAGLLATRPDAAGKVLIDYDATPAFVMADHQVAFAYIKPGREQQVLRVLTALPGVEQAISSKADLERLRLGHPRAGSLLLLASPSAWFAHDWWRSEEEKPAWQFTVDIHNKPGFDPRELFFDPQKKCIAQDASLVKGSHGLVDDSDRWPVLLADAPLPAGSGGRQLGATAIAPWLASLLRA